MLWTFHRLDGSGKGTRDPWGEEMATVACAATCLSHEGGRLAGRLPTGGERYWDGLGR